ncbi:RidA family protein [Fontivita pretiosa]|uniref:RidA family protein n=1 Tax=Fontivita pretiosa TaxID=2989684 RepID=UPI003D167A73
MNETKPKKLGVYPGGQDTSTGPYSPGVAVGELVFVAGQGPLDPQTGQIVGTTIEEHTELTLNNVKRILEAAGCTMDDCVKTTVHLKDIGEFERFNAVYRRFFNKPYPARTTVQSVLWSTIRVEIDAVAIRGCGQNKTGNTP